MSDANLMRNGFSLHELYTSPSPQFRLRESQMGVASRGIRISDEVSRIPSGTIFPLWGEANLPYERERQPTSRISAHPDAKSLGISPREARITTDATVPGLEAKVVQLEGALRRCRAELQKEVSDNIHLLSKAERTIDQLEHEKRVVESNTAELEHEALQGRELKNRLDSKMSQVSQLRTPTRNKGEPAEQA